jgi:DNA-binding SARP family transcriptional activator
MAAAFLQRILAIERTEEQAHRDLMLVYAQEGRRSEALRQYEQCTKVLSAELGIEPEPETTELYRRISRGEIAPVRPASYETGLGLSNLLEPGTLPPPAGREGWSPVEWR